MTAAKFVTAMKIGRKLGRRRYDRLTSDMDKQLDVDFLTDSVSLIIQLLSF